MLYPLLRLIIKIALHWYISIFHKQGLVQIATDKPNIIIANHPNSFFDALLLAVSVPAKISFLVRGDIFKNKLANSVLRKLNMLPIYKKIDAVDFVAKNEVTFEDCISKMKQGESIIIFPEGKSYNDWTLHPYKKGGLSNLIEKALAEAIDFNIQPFSIIYNSYKQVPKRIILKALAPYKREAIINRSEENLPSFIQSIEDQHRLTPIDPDETIRLKANVPKYLILPLAAIGYLTHYPLYILVSNWIRNKTKNTIFFDSVFFGALLIIYPIYLMLIFSLMTLFFNVVIGLLITFILLISSWSFVKSKQ